NCYPEIENAVKYINAEKVHGEGFLGRGQIVGIIDTGIDSREELLKDRVVESEDFTWEGTTEDLHGHGTLVALIIRHVAPEARFLNAKALCRDGRGTSEALARALRWMAKRPTTVVNI